MKILYQYMMRQNLFLIVVCMGLGVVIYLLSDIFDRLDDFLEAGVGIAIVLTYFGSKIPLILSQILPAVFLIALIVQLSLMERSRELLALQTGGVSLWRLSIFFIIYAIVWSCIQIGFSQALGVWGLELSSRIWQEDVRGRDIDWSAVEKTWFREGERIVTFERANPDTGRGEVITVYTVSEDWRRLEHLASADSFRFGPQTEGDYWMLPNAEVHEPHRFQSEKGVDTRTDIAQDLAAFIAVKPKTDPKQLPIWTLGRVISQLEASGSNVEVLRTAWHGKLAYGFSILNMALVALAVATLRRNIYVNIGIGLVATFVFYSVVVLGSTAGQMGIVPAWLGAWLGNIGFGLATVARLWWAERKHD